MTKIGDNDGEMMMILARCDTGGSLDHLAWEDARARLVAFLADGQTTGSAEIFNRAEAILCALWSGTAS